MVKSASMLVLKESAWGRLYGGEEMGFFKDSGIDDLPSIEDSVLVFHELEDNDTGHSQVSKKETLTEIEEKDEFTEFIELSEKANLTKEEKKRLKKLTKYITGQATTKAELVRDWIGMIIIFGALAYYFSLPIKIREYNASLESGVNDYLAMEEVINSEYEALKEMETKKYAVVSIETLNVRKEPDEASARLGQLNKNEEVEVVDILEGQDFIQISYQNQDGYIHRDFVEIINKSVEKK